MSKIAFHLNCLTHGGAERVVTNLANQFAQEGYEVLVATEWTDEDEFVLDSRVKRVHVGLRTEDEHKSRLAKYFRRVHYLHEFMQKEKPDVLVAFARLAIFRALMACRHTGVPVVISVRIDPTKSYVGFRNTLQIRRYFGRAAGAVFQTEDARKFFAPRLQEQSRIILNPLTDKYIGVPEPDRRRKEIVNVARLADFKNQPLLVEAFARVHEKYPDYILKIYGPDSEDGSKERIEEQIRKYQLDGAVLLMGGSDQLEKEVPGAAVFAYSSDYEGMPNSVMEAMAMGLPVVSTDCPCGGPRMIIKDHQNGILVPVGDAEALAEGILYLIEHPQEADRMGREARKIAEVANAQAVFEQWRDYLNEVMKNGKRC
ncbi:MAG: glycosyltransferase family 4 protein [Butyrivibrio sp.]|jgi:glycosyltransferase involved in cell wall biosynthesis|nr:glycosyltransferase family 4 protein [Butyrivibrio sp.]